jgi:hypothetical protein
LAKFFGRLSGPETNVDPTLVQMFPENWVAQHDCPCYVICGNWLDATTDQFVTQKNIQIVIKASGSNPQKGDKPPTWGYGTNIFTGCQPKIFVCPINHRRIVSETWLEICKACIHMWAHAPSGKPPPIAFIHCNEGVNRAPALFALLAAKFQGCQPSWPAWVLAEARQINAMYSEGVRAAEGRDFATWNMMHAVAETTPLSVQFRATSLFETHESVMCAYVPMDERMKEFLTTRVTAKVRLTPAREVANRPPKAKARPCAVADNRGFLPATDEDRARLASTRDHARVASYSEVEHAELLALPLVVNYDHRRWADMDDDQGCQPSWTVGFELQDYLDRPATPGTAFLGSFAFNREGRHVLHQLAQDFRHERNSFSHTLWMQAMWATLKLCEGGLNVRTTGRYPPNATPLHMACRQEWKAWGCQPCSQAQIIEEMLEWGCDATELSNRGDTVLMEMAGAGNTSLFSYFYRRIVKEKWCPFDMQAENEDERNLYSIAGLAHDKDEEKCEYRKHVNPGIKAMVQHLVHLKYVGDYGLATHSGAQRGRKRRVEEQAQPVPAFPKEVVTDLGATSGEEDVTVDDHAAASSSSMKKSRRLEKETPQSSVGVSISSDSEDSLAVSRSSDSEDSLAVSSSSHSEDLGCSDRPRRHVTPSSASAAACAEADAASLRLDRALNRTTPNKKNTD